MKNQLELNNEELLEYENAINDLLLKNETYESEINDYKHNLEILTQVRMFFICNIIVLKSFYSFLIDFFPQFLQNYMIFYFK